jgi:gp32 DNA binding protein like
MSEDILAHLRRSKESNLKDLVDAAKKLTTNEFPQDERFWYPQLDKSGTGSGLMRFLPPPAPETIGFVRYWYHSFQRNGKWYIENCLTSIGQDDPVVEYNAKLYASSTDKNSPARKQVSQQKRKLTYVSNIYVIKDPATPANEGKVFLFKYGKTIFDMIQKQMSPDSDGLTTNEPINPFDLWTGADFAFRVHRDESGYTKYTNSQFQRPSAFLGSDEARAEVWKQTHSLQSFLDPSNFKEYGLLKKKLNMVLGLDGSNIPSEKPPEERSVPETHGPVLETQADDDTTESVDQNELDSFFKNLAK